MKAYEIPLSPEPQLFNIQLAGVTYYLTLRWNGEAEAWRLDIAAQDRTPLLNGLLVVTGLDLLGQYAYLGFGGMLIVQTDADPDAVPTFENLGKEGHIFFVVKD
ncbi:hypothetical protein ZHS_25 [Edwardsiella phage vB_EpM_ZHS]|jgi:hypothetical protein|nr:hypothetical protein ZHS_25 [Edwardsiella phage vB_EpM_ZHS]